jgi:osmotically-inducible protein OsmY
MKSDILLKEDVEQELEWELGKKAAEVGVAVKDGVVVLNGYMESYADKWAAERAVKRVSGVTAAANEIEVKLPNSSQRSDLDIARAAQNALEWNAVVPHDRIEVVVENGWIAMEGEVESQYQRDAAERAVRNLFGVKGVSNLIMMRPKVSPTAVKAKIEDALKRNATLDSRRINVTSSDSKVTLTGTVRAWIEREEAEKAALAAQGVKQVENLIRVEP